MSKNPVKQKRLGEKEFVENYVRNSILFDGETPTLEDISTTWNIMKNLGKKKRVKRNSKPEMSKEEFIERHHRNDSLLGEAQNEEEANRWYDLYKFERQYNAVRGMTKKQTEAKKAAFLESMEQIMKARYSH